MNLSDTGICSMPFTVHLCATTENNSNVIYHFHVHNTIRNMQIEFYIREKLNTIYTEIRCVLSAINIQ